MKHLSAEDSSTWEPLARVVQSTTSHPALGDDLLQEALLHAWLIVAHRPGQTASWYLQSCKFHLRHYLDSGRSIDSLKRSAGQLPLAGDSDGHEEFVDQTDSGESVFACFSARDIISVLSRHLLPPEKAVLDCLAEGLGAREIGRKLKVSHTLVIQQRRKIASLLTKLEKPSLPSSRIVNNIVINEGPATAVIEKASERKIQAVPVQELRHKQEAAIAARQRTPTSTVEKKESRETKTVAAHEPPQVQKPAAATPGSVAPAPRNNEAQSEKHQPVPAAPEGKPEARPAGNNPAANKPPTEQKAEKHVEKQEKPAKPSGKKVQRPAREKTGRTRRTKTTRTKSKSSCIEVGNRPLAGNK